MGPENTIFVAIIVACHIAVYTDARPEKAFAKGYSGRNLPPGKWTRWFDSSYPGMVGDFETVENVVRKFGRGCDGLPCRRPLAVKVISVYGLTPREHRERVHLHARTGFICRNTEQHDRKCMNYKVRFYCPHSQRNCQDNSGSQDNILTKAEKQTKLAKLRAKEHGVKFHNEAANYFNSDDKMIVEMPEYLKYAKFHEDIAPKVILPNLRGKLAQLPDYNDAMTSGSRGGATTSEEDVLLSYLKEDAPSDPMTSGYDARKTVMKDSAPSVNDRGQSYFINNVAPQGQNSISFRHFRRHPRAPFG